MGKKKKELILKRPKTLEKAAQVSELVMSPTVSSAAVIKAYNPGVDDLNVAALNEELAKQNKRVAEGDVTRMEEILICHAHSLDAVFQSMLIKAAKCKQQKGVQFYMNMGLKAQRQCTAVLTTLTNLKKPRVYVKNLIGSQNYTEKSTIHNMGVSHNCNARLGADQIPSDTLIIEDNTQNAIGANLPPQYIRYGDDAQAYAPWHEGT